MKSAPTEARSFEFCFPQLDTLVQVEASDDGIIIRASRDTFSEQRKTYFVRELAEEGFIDDRFRWMALTGDFLGGGVQWVVDCSWIKISAGAVKRARRFVATLFCSTVLLLGLLLASLCPVGTVAPPAASGPAVSPPASVPDR